MNSKASNDYVANIVRIVKDNVKSKQIVLEKKRLSTQSEQVVYQAIKQFNSEMAIAVDEVIYDEDSHQFPDIVIKFLDGFCLGIEVKSSSANKKSWAINGNSVLGSTSVAVDDMYIVFIKLNDQGFQVNFGRYEDSIADVVVTHSPRYKIDLSIDKSQNFFKKSGIDYNTIKKSDNPISLITQYFRREGKTAWWLGDNNEDQSTSATILSWQDVEDAEIDQIYGEAFVLFPEIINGPPSIKYSRLAKWLVAKYSIADSSLRDKFTAGGKVNLPYQGGYIEGAPKVYETLAKYSQSIEKAFLEIDQSELEVFWADYPPNQEGADSVEARKRYWYKLLCANPCDQSLLGYVAELLKINFP